MSSLWKPLAPLFSKNNKNCKVFINSDLIEFTHIDLDTGNGIVAKRDISLVEQKNADLIVEPALICSVSGNFRKNNILFDYCSLCGAFLLPSKESIDSRQLLHFDLIQKHADETGFSKLPIWFQKRAEHENHEIANGYNRCDSCHQYRVLSTKTKSKKYGLPQSLEECKIFFQNSANFVEADGFSQFVEQYEEMCMKVDEGLFCVMRASLMILDEVLFEQDEIIILSSTQKQNAENSDEQSHQESSFFDIISSRFREKLEEFCSSFDEGVVPSNSSSSSSALVFRSACNLLNEILRGIVIMTARDNNNNNNNDDPIGNLIINLQQFFLLRCVLQNNQHKAVIPNPVTTFLKVFLSSSPSKKHLKEEEKEEKDENENNSETQQLRRQLRLKISEEIEASSNMYQDITASALFLHTSRLNHSCYPNAHVEPSLTRGGASVRISVYGNASETDEENEDESSSAKVIKKGDQITISYLGYDETKLFDKKAEAHAYLKKNYGFECRD